MRPSPTQNMLIRFKKYINRIMEYLSDKFFQTSYLIHIDTKPNFFKETVKPF